VQRGARWARNEPRRIAGSALFAAIRTRVVPFAVSSEGPRMRFTGHMVLPIKIAKTILASRVLPRRGIHKGRWISAS
jgi:hypothetical protein